MDSKVKKKKRNKGGIGRDILRLPNTRSLRPVILWNGELLLAEQTTFKI